MSKLYDLSNKTSIRKRSKQKITIDYNQQNKNEDVNNYQDID